MTLVDDFRRILHSHNKAMCNYKKAEIYYKNFQRRDKTQLAVSGTQSAKKGEKKLQPKGIEGEIEITHSLI